MLLIIKMQKGLSLPKKHATDESMDYWLIDLTYGSDTPQYGDTIIINNSTFTNVVKVKGLTERLKQIGMRVSLDFKMVTSYKVEAAGCGVQNPVTFKLKELFIINQGEIRYEPMRLTYGLPQACILLAPAHK